MHYVVLTEELVITMKFNKEEKKLLIEAICNEQTKIIIHDHKLYDSPRYIKLESLKVKIKDM